MSKHVEKAKKWLEYSGNQNPEVDGKAMHSVALAQVEATLALAEQARIANLLRLREEVDSGTRALFYDVNSGVEGKGVHLALRPEIAQALGVES